VFKNIIKDVSVQTKTKKIDWQIINNDPFSAIDMLEKACEKTERETEKMGDILFLMGLCRLEIRTRRSCPRKKAYNLEEAIEAFKKALKEYPLEAKKKIEQTKVVLEKARDLR